VLKEEKSEDYERALELSFERIDQKAAAIKNTGLELLGIEDDIF